MGLLDSIFGSSSSASDKQSLPWKPLTTEGQLHDIIEQSKLRPQLIFKHSTRCGISRMTLNQFESIFPSAGLEADIYYLDLLNFRAVSNKIAEQFEVYHQSPQVLILKNGIVVAHDSHGAITQMDFKKYS